MSWNEKNLFLYHLSLLAANLHFHCINTGMGVSEVSISSLWPSVLEIPHVSESWSES